MPKYVIVWKYKIKPEFKEKFEFEYGMNGTWSALFRKSKSYTGSYLNISEMEPDTYLLIDIWANKVFYEKFIASHSEEYHKLSSKFEYFYELEEKIGMFNTLE